MNRRLFAFFLVFLASLFLTSPIYVNGEVTPVDLVFTVYSDGETKVEYSVEGDPLKVRVDVSLFGTHFDDLIIVNQYDFPLESSVIDSSVKIDSIGATKIFITYSTSSLTTKTGLIWTFNVTTPIPSKILLPKQSTIFELWEIPRSIVYEDERPMLTQDSGQISISYIIGVPNTMDQAIKTIAEAEEYIEIAVSQGIILDEAQNLLDEAKETFLQKQYHEADLIAGRSKESAVNTIETASLAYSMINNAYNAIDVAREEGRRVGLIDLEMRLREVEESCHRGEYHEAFNSASQIYYTVKNAKKPHFLTLPVIGGALIFGFVISLRIQDSEQESIAETALKKEGNEIPQRKPFYQLVRKPAIDPSKPVNLTMIFEDHPNLRRDENEVIRFLAEGGREFTMREIRERFDIPRSSAWRLARRLIEHGILMERKLGRQSLLRINEKYRGA